MPFKPEEMMAKEEMVARSIIALLEDRRGFYGWWGDVDEAIQEDIIKKIAKRIAVYYNQYP